MNCHTLDRFRGAWLGSTIAALSPKQGRDNRINPLLLQSFVAREQIAKILLKSPRLEVDALVNLLAAESNTTAWENLSNLTDAERRDRVNNYRLDNNQSALVESREELVRSDKYSNRTLSWLSLIIFYADNWILLRAVIRKYYSRLSSAEIEKEDLLIWSYLMSSILNSSWETNCRDFSQLIKRVLTDVVVKRTTLTGQLEIVVKAAERGMSLPELSDRLLARGNPEQTAIALSCYCLVTTPLDFKLSVQRVTNLKPEIAWLATTLTGTVSGAYNGMARIAIDWRKMANQNSAYRTADRIILELFKAWLGIDPDRTVRVSDLELQAIAVPHLIQPRKSLKIISQKPPFNF